MTSSPPKASDLDRLDTLDLEETKALLAQEVERLNRLKRRQRDLVHLAAEESREKSFREIGETLGLSEERVRQIHNIALAKIRTRHSDLADLLNRTTEP